jgi:ABC-type nitrate/sulfonate/bicarbonate transport system permease component
MQTDYLIAGVLLLSLIGLTIGIVLGRLENWLLRWR